MAARIQTLRDRQIGEQCFPCHRIKTDSFLASIERILSLNRDDSSASGSSSADPSGGSQTTPLLNENGEPIWKVLVFDNLGRDIISSVLRVNDLRSKGVTIHLSVGQDATKTTSR